MSPDAPGHEAAEIEMKIALDPWMHGRVTLTGLPELVAGVAVGRGGGFCRVPERVAVSRWLGCGC